MKIEQEPSVMPKYPTACYRTKRGFLLIPSYTDPEIFVGPGGYRIGIIPLLLQKPAHVTEWLWDRRKRPAD